MAELTTLEERFEAIENLCNSHSTAFIRRFLRLKDLQGDFYDMLLQENTATSDKEADAVFDNIQIAVDILEKRIPFGFTAMLQDWEPDEKGMNAEGYNLMSTRRMLQDSIKKMHGDAK